jgi:hypothetical protein
VQAQEGLVVDTEVVELVAPPPPAAAVVMGEEWVVTETAAPQMGSESRVGTGPGDDDVVMVPAGQGALPPPPAKGHEAVAPEAPETPAAVTTLTIDGVEDAPTFGTWSPWHRGHRS